MDIGQIVEIFANASVPTMLIVLGYGGYKKWWVFGWLYERERQEKDEWKHAALKTTNLAAAFAARSKPSREE